MKLDLSERPRLGQAPTCRARCRQRGSAVFVVIVFLSIMCIYVSANLKLLWQLDRELKLIEKRQLKKFERPVPTPLEKTNVIHQPSAGARLGSE